MSRVQPDKVYPGNDLDSIKRAIEQLSEFTTELDTRRVSANTTLESDDDLVLVTTGAGNITITLPYIDDAQRKSYWVKKIDAGGGQVTVQGSGSETIDGGTVTLANPLDVVHLIAERNTNITSPIRGWHVV